MIVADLFLAVVEGVVEVDLAPGGHHCPVAAQPAAELRQAARGGWARDTSTTFYITLFTCTLCIHIFV